MWYSCRNTPTPRGSSRLTHDLQDRQRCELCAKPARKRPSVQPTDADNLFKQTPVGGAGFTRGWPLMKQRRAFAAITLALLIVTPAIAWEAFKPVRILAPTLNGVTCVARVCVQETADLALAQRLQNNALEAVGRKLSPLERAPLTVFCSTRECYQSFGGGLERGAAILDWGVILPPESWVAHIVEHEYIHALQAQQLGLLGRERTPLWFKEGMPFLISAPPDHDLPAYARPLVARYQTWEQQHGRTSVWQRARDL